MDIAGIRIAKITDIPQILEIKRQSHEFFVENRPDLYELSDKLYTEDFLEDFFHSADKHILIAELQGRIVGYALVQAVNVRLPMMTERLYLYLHDMAVSECFRNQGIASSLLDHIERYSLSIGAEKIELAVHLFCTGAIALYRKYGFTERTVRMEKQLGD